jgi:hypothetical protein
MFKLRLVITKHKRGFGLRLPSSNGKIMYNAETFTQKPAVWKNILATMKFYGAKNKVLIQDSSLQEPVVYEGSLGGNGKLMLKATDIKPKN